MRSDVAERVQLRAVGGETVPVTVETAYGGEDRNLFFLIPADSLSYDTDYEVVLERGLRTISGDETTAGWSFSFRTRCSLESLDDCPPLEPELVTGPVPTMPPPREPNPTADGGRDAEPASRGGCAIGVHGEHHGREGLLFSVVVLAFCVHRYRRKYR